jgi:hypothetical protein
VIGPIFFEGTVNSDGYLSDILELFFQELTEEEIRYGYFQEDSSMAHTARISMQRLRDVFDEQIISQGFMATLLPQSLFVTFMCAVIQRGKCIKQSMICRCTEIRNIVHSINGDKLKRVF